MMYALFFGEVAVAAIAAYLWYWLDERDNK